MRKFFLRFILLLSIFTIILVPAEPTFARRKRSNSSNENSAVNDFTFKNFHADYELTKDAEGYSKLDVTETLVANFTHENTNHGIMRIIPIFNQAGRNQIIDDPYAFKATVTRNGQSEKFESSVSDSNIKLKIGDADTYLSGEQTYVIKYSFDNVVAAFKDVANSSISGAYQELYWNINGVDWKQPFEQVSGTLHFSDEIASTIFGNPICYSGAYRSNDTDKCQIEKTKNSIAFSANNLKAGEGATFVIAIKADTFKIRPPKYNYIAVAVCIIIGIFSFFTIFSIIRNYQKHVREKHQYYKSLIRVPQYQPRKDLTVGQAGFFSFTPLNQKTATVLSLAVHKKIDIIKNPIEKNFLGFNKKQSWSVKILNTDSLSSEEKSMLRVLAQSSTLPEVGEVFKLKQNNSYSVNQLIMSYDTNVKLDIAEKGLTEDNKRAGIMGVLDSIIGVHFIIIFGGMLFGIASFFPFFPKLLSWLLRIADRTIHITSFYIYKPELFILAAAIFIGTSIAASTYNHFARKYHDFTNAGLDIVVYMQGLKDYINLAESERINFLQNVKDVDTSPEGIVHLYEELLPYAALFGLEKTWIQNLNKYYEELGTDYTIPTWYALSYADFGSFTSSISSSSSTYYTSSSSGGSGYSSGGGFSGGGGGGGGGGGW